MRAQSQIDTSTQTAVLTASVAEARPAKSWLGGMVSALRAMAPAAAITMGLLAAGCGPTYPNCENDDHCKSKGEFCLDNKCAECRLDKQCAGADTDVCVTCQAGACGRKADCCSTKLDCGTGKKCDSNRCVAECAADTDCAAGSKCSGGACISGSADGGASTTDGAGCTGDKDCGPGLSCKEGRCIGADGKCGLAPIYFDFNEYTLSAQAQGGLSANAKCMKERKMTTMVIEGHCDERGTDAYNMELGNRRAKVAKEYLQQLQPKTKIKTMSYGKAKPVCQEDSEDCHGRNRRAELQAK